jgi:hypothetical protein
MITATVEGIPELRAALRATHEKLVIGLRGASLAAAKAGIEEARANHPYTDRTTSLSQDSYAEQVDVDGALMAEMVWAPPVRPVYASYVNEGTTRNKAYPFTPQAERKAQEVLEHETIEVVNAVVAEINSL